MANTKKFKNLTWGQIAEPYVNEFEHPEILLAAVEIMVESARSYWQRGRWGAFGVSQILLGQSATDQHKRGWHVKGSWEQLIQRCRDTITTGMLTQKLDAPLWREQNNIQPDAKVRIQGPLGEDYKACREAWERLNHLSGKHIIPLNPFHRDATQIRFVGLTMLPPWELPQQADGETVPKWKIERDWKVTFMVDCDGSSWELEFLCENRDGESPDWYQPPAGIENFDWSKTSNETLTSYFRKVADFVEGLLQKP
jgi:hypothetical protein